MNPRRWLLGATFALLGAIHEIAARCLSGTTLVAALLSPSGGRSALVLLLAMAFLVVRLVLFLFIPGLAGALFARWAARACAAWIERSRSVARGAKTL